MKKSQKSKVNCQMLRSRGFSMLEVLIVVAIMVIMTAVMFAMDNDSSAKKDVDAAATQIRAQLRALQNEALTGKNIEGASACMFEFDSSSSSYTIRYRKCDTTIIKTMPAVVLKKVTMDANVITFLSPRGNTSSNSITITSKKDNSVNVVVSLNAYGNIE